MANQFGWILASWPGEDEQSQFQLREASDSSWELSLKEVSAGRIIRHVMRSALGQGTLAKRQINVRNYHAQRKVVSQVLFPGGMIQELGVSVSVRFNSPNSHFDLAVSVNGLFGPKGRKGGCVWR